MYACYVKELNLLGVLCVTASSCILLFNLRGNLNFGGLFFKLAGKTDTFWGDSFLYAESVIQGSEDKDSEKFPEESHDAEWVERKQQLTLITD